MKYILYYRYRFGETEASAAAMEQQRDAAELLKSDGHEVEAEYIEYEAAPRGQSDHEPRPKLRMAFAHVASLREQGVDAQLAILHIGSIGTGEPFEWVDEGPTSADQPMPIIETLEARGEAGELLRKYRGVIDPDWGFEYALHQIAVEDYFRRKRRREKAHPRQQKHEQK